MVSKRAMPKNKIIILGKKSITAPTPAIIPSAKAEAMKVLEILFLTSSPKALKPDSI